MLKFINGNFLMQQTTFKCFFEWNSRTACGEFRRGKRTVQRTLMRCLSIGLIFLEVKYVFSLEACSK